jgi:spore germination protein YaaH
MMTSYPASAARQVRREQLVDQIAIGVTEPEFDGVLLDFEEMGGYPSKEQAKQAKEGYTAFVQGVVAHLRPRGKKVGVALHPSEGYEGYDHDALAQHGDFVVLMAHDFQKPDREDPEPLDRVEKAIRDMLDLGVSAERILLAAVLRY